jgi:microcystin-dependent protein
MTTKLTLSVPPKFKRTAAMLSRRRKKSISALFVEFVEREANKHDDTQLTEFALVATNNTGGFMTTTTGDSAQSAHTGNASASQGQQIGGQGGGTAHNNMPPFIAFRALIKT